MTVPTPARSHHARRRRPLAAVLAGGLVASGATMVLAAATPASATATPTPVCSTTTCTVTYDYTGAPGSFTVPAGVTSIGLDVGGAQAGAGVYSSAAGLGGRTTGTLPVAAGQQVSVLVGQAGSVGGLATYGGGGASGWNNAQAYLSSGGGGSFVYSSAGALLAAAGGGGGGGSGLPGGDGAGAGLNGADGGVESFWVQYGSTPAYGGTQSAGGVAGYNANHNSRGGDGSGPAANGAPGQGGNGGYSAGNPYFGGGGGGGGYFGGGGGGNFHGGAGGSGFAASSLADVDGQSGVRSGDGQVVLSYDRPVSAPRNPRLTATATSSHRASNGWFRSPVTVRFTCTPALSPLVEPCPAPVVLAHDGADQSVTRTVLAQDGGSATASLTGISVDRKAPMVQVVGKGRSARCVATDALSGVARCTVARTSGGGRTRLVATAVDRAGNVATSSTAVGRLRITVRGVTRHHGRFTVHAGSTYTVVARGRHSRPVLLSVVPAAGSPQASPQRFHGTGKGRWVASMTVPSGAVGAWKLGVRTPRGTTMVRLRVLR